MAQVDLSGGHLDAVDSSQVGGSCPFPVEVFWHGPNPESKSEILMVTGVGTFCLGVSAVQPLEGNRLCHGNTGGRAWFGHSHAERNIVNCGQHSIDIIV